MIDAEPRKPHHKLPLRGFGSALYPVTTRWFRWWIKPRCLCCGIPLERWQPFCSAECEEKDREERSYGF